MAVHRLALFIELDGADDLPIALDDEPSGRSDEIAADLLGIELAPPPQHVGFAPDLDEPGQILGAPRPQDDSFSHQDITTLGHDPKTKLRSWTVDLAVRSSPPRGKR